MFLSAQEKRIEGIGGIMKMTMKKRMKEYKNSPMSMFLAALVFIAAALAIFIIVSITGYILIKGVPHLKASLFQWEFTSANQSMLPAIINTLVMTTVALVIATPLGIFSAVYLTEYAKKGNRLVGIIRVTTETLSGIPSIVYGLFGMLFFVSFIGWGYSIVAGAFTVAIMILPLIIRTTEEAIIAVPDLYREGSFGLGAGKLRTTFKIVLPSAIPGILAGVILGIGRIVGETAALMYTSGTVAHVAKDLSESGRTLALHMYSLSREGLHTNEAYATAVVLLIVVIIINGVSSLLAKGLSKGKDNGQ